MDFSGGGDGGGSVAPGAAGRQVVAYMDVHRGGFATVGRSTYDPHDFGRNEAGEPVRPLFLSVAALYHRRPTECGPLAFGDRPWLPGGTFPFPVRVEFGLDGARPHYYHDHTGARRAGAGAWDWHTWSPFSPPGGISGGGPSCAPPGGDDSGGGGDPTGDGGDPTGNNRGGDPGGGGPGGDPGGGGDLDGGGGGGGGGDPGGGGGGSFAGIPDATNPYALNGDLGPPLLGGQPDPYALGGDLGPQFGSGAGVAAPPPSPSPPPMGGTTLPSGAQAKGPAPVVPPNGGPSGSTPLQTPFVVGVPGLAGVPASIGGSPGGSDLRFGQPGQTGGRVTPAATRAWEAVAPVVASAEFFGRQQPGTGLFERTTPAAVASRFARGTGDGGLAVMPPELGVEDVRPGVATRRNLGTTSTTALAAVRADLWVARSLDLAAGTPVDGWRFRQDGTTKQLTLAYLDEDGVAGTTTPLNVDAPLNATSAQLVATTNVAFAASPYSVAGGDYALIVSTAGGAVTVNLPAASGGKRLLMVGNFAGANNVTVAPAGADTLTSKGTLTPGKTGIYVSNGSSGWFAW